MPAPVPPPQTLKQAKRAYQKSNKAFTFTASQERAAARRNAKDEYARKLRDKDERSKNNKRKRDEKEEKERQAKKVLIEKGKLSEDALLPKVRSSQPRLSAFLRLPTKTVAGPVRPLPQHEEDDETFKADSDDENTLVNENRPPAPSPPKMDEEELEFFSTAPSGEENMMAGENFGGENGIAQSPNPNPIQTQPRSAVELGTDELEAQLGCRLSQAMVDFDICEDPFSDAEQTPIFTPSPLKRKRSGGDFATPTKSARSALSEMSPGRVFLRSQEKPDTTSAPSLAACMLSPLARRSEPTSSQLVQDTLAMISTQDFTDDLEFSDAKENTDPVRDVSHRQQPPGSSQGRCAGNAEPGKSKSAMPHQIDDVDLDDSALDDLLGGDEDDGYDENDLTEAEWAGLSTQPAKNTAVSVLGSPKKAKATHLQTLSKAMAPPPCPSPVADLISKLRAVTPKKFLQPKFRASQCSPSASCSFDFDDGINDADLAGLDMQTTRRNGTPKRDRVSSEYELPPASQSFGLDDGMDDDLLALVEETDFAGSSATKKARKGRALPWEKRPSNWNAMMADDERSQPLDGITQRSA